MRASLLVGLALTSLAACDSRQLLSDEGVYLGERIGNAAEALRASSDTISMVEFSPREGVDQAYTVGIGASRWCPSPPCNPAEETGLTVSVERGRHGSTTVHKRHVAVPAALHIDKHGAPTIIELRKHGAIIDVVALR